MHTDFILGHHLEHLFNVFVEKLIKLVDLDFILRGDCPTRCHTVHCTKLCYARVEQVLQLLHLQVEVTVATLFALLSTIWVAYLTQC